MDVTSANTITRTPNTQAASPVAKPKGAINSDFNTFLKMLTTQIKNQDPTNPMDSADFAVQLATFSGVEQQVKTNDMLGTLSSQFGVMGMSQLAAWVGQEARAPSPVYMGDSAVTLTYASAAGADRAVVSVRNEKGELVAREDVPLGKGPYQWAGKAADGADLPNGKYSLTLESYQGDRKLGDPTPVEAYSRIQEARSGAAGTVLVLEGGIEVAATAVTALRVAGAGSAGAAGTGAQSGPATGNAAASGNNLGGAHGAASGATSQAPAPPAQAPLNQPPQPEPESYRPD